MIFFKPLPNFLPAFTKEFKRLTKKKKMAIVEIGCGPEAHIVKLLRDAKLPAIGVDPMFDPLGEGVPMDIMGSVLPQTAEECAMIKTMPSIILSCRPCHSGFTAVVNRSRHPESAFYYVGLDRNVEKDFLPEMEMKLVTKDPVGEEGEKLWQVSDVGARFK